MKRFSIYFFLLATIGFGSTKAQDPYWSANSDYYENPLAPNGQFGFDYTMIGTIASPSIGTKPFLVYFNSADGSWAVDDYSALTFGIPYIREGEEFIFCITYANGDRRVYTRESDGADGEENKYYEYRINNPEAVYEMWMQGNLAFDEFLRTAVVLDTEDHPEFGPQQLYEGKINGQIVTFEITSSPAPINITPKTVGYICGAFKDNERQQNRYITYFKGPAMTISMNYFQRVGNQFYMEGFEGETIEYTFDPESRIALADRWEAISAEMKEIQEEKLAILRRYNCNKGNEAARKLCRSRREAALLPLNQRLERLVREIQGEGEPTAEDTAVTDNCFICELGTGEQMERIEGCELGDGNSIQIRQSWPKDRANPEPKIIVLYDQLDEYKNDLLLEGYSCN